MKQLTLCILLFLTFSKKTQAQTYSYFDYKKGNSATVFAMENADPKESFLLAFRFPSHINLLFLNDKLQLTRMQKTGAFDADIWHKSMLGIVNLEKEIFVFMPTAEFGSSLDTDLYKFNKEDGSVKQIPLRMNPEQVEELSDSHVKLVKIFQYENRFYKIWVNTKTSRLYIFYYEMGEINHMGFESLDLPIAGIGKRLGRRKAVPTPIITNDKDVSLISNAKQEKIYMFESEMLITVEDTELGNTDLIAINTDTWDLSLESYSVSGFQTNSDIQNLNSYIYEGVIYQILYNSEGLRLQKTDFDTGDLLSEIRWPTEEDFIQDFPLRKKRQLRGNKLQESDIEPAWQWFERSIAVLIQPEDSVERLIIGSHIYMDQRGRDIINTVSLLSTVGGSVAGGASFSLLGSGGNFNISIDPFASINSIIDATFYLGEGRMFQYDTFFNSESFDISTKNVVPARWEEIMEKVDEEEQKQKLKSVTLFEREDKVYLGYWRKKKYYLLKF